MQNEIPVPPLPSLPPILRPKESRRNRITLKLLFIAGLVLLLQAPLHWVNQLQKERRVYHGETAEPAAITRTSTAVPSLPETTEDKFAPYRMVERSLKHGVLVLALVFAAFFLFETLAGLRLHAVHYGLVGGALCLFYLALLALGEVLEPGPAYIGAAVASSALIVFYSASILGSAGRAVVIAALLASVHGVLYVVLRMEYYALLAGTAALFAALGATMFFTRNVDWNAQEAAEAAR